MCTSMIGKEGPETHPSNPHTNTRSPLSGEQLSKGDPIMGRICSITAAMVLLTVPWVSAGTFEVLAQGAPIATLAPLQATPGTVVKAEYKSEFPGAPRMRTESDIFVP